MLKYEGSLHGHTDYSNLRLRDAINTIEELIDYSIELGQSVIAFTEHETVSNAVKIEKYYKKVKEKHPDFKVIRGNEIYLCRNGLDGTNYVRGQDRFYHFILLAKDAIGHQQIRELSTRAWSHSFQTGKMVRVPTYYSDIIDVIGANPGHVIGSTACLGGFLDVKLLEYYNSGNSMLYDKIKGWLNNMIGIFGKDDFYLEMQPSASEEQRIANKLIRQMSKETGIPYIITCDEHYLKKSDAPIHSAFLKAEEGEREVDEFYRTTYLMDTEELEGYMNDYMSVEDFQYAYQNIIDIRDKCEDYSLLKELKIPSLKWEEVEIEDSVRNKYMEQIPYMKIFHESDFDGDRLLVDLVIKKLESDTRLQNEETYKEINSNLETTYISSQTNKTHWSAYFLNLKGIIEECWNAGTLVGPGRGSGVGFLLLYLLDIIQINPLWETTKTFSWRFLNPARVSVLDIDTDIEGSKRATVLEALRNKYGHDRVANVLTFGTEKSKSAIQTAARGLGIEHSEALYIASLIPADRGQTRTLKQCYYGDEENNLPPIAQFKREMDARPELWKVAQKIEGLICRMGEHAGGVIFVDEPFVNSTALMKVPNGDVVTQFDLHDCEDCSLIKIDLLSVECLDKIHTTLDLLCDDGYIERKPTLKETYESVLGIYNIERQETKMWQMVWDHKIQSLFQMEKQSGIQGIELIHPKSVDELAVLNSVIRLMAPDENSDQPLVMWAKYRENINLWYKEMKDYGLSQEEIDWLSQHSAITEGICESQEGLMSLVQEERLGGNSLSFADKCRKGIAKKQGSLFEECENIYFEEIKKKHCSEKLAHYVWDVLLRVQRGYSFNRSHCLAYSLIALQEMNLAYKYPLIYWNTACLITNSGGTKEEGVDKEEVVDIYEVEKDEMTHGVTYEDLPDRSGKVKRTASVNYDKIARAIGKTRKEGIDIALPDINKSKYTFSPNVEENKIYFGLRGILNVGEDVVNSIMSNRPYSSPQDFIDKINPKKDTMVALIKSGAFDSMQDRVNLMKDYIKSITGFKSKLNMQNFASLLQNHMILFDTDEKKMSYRVYEFTRYLKATCKKDKETYQLSNRAITFLQEIDEDDLIQVDMTMSVKAWDKVYQRHMLVFKNWIKENENELLEVMNNLSYQENWNKYASGNLSSWEMEVLCFYYHEHELINAKVEKFGCVDFFSLPEEPEVIKQGVAKNGRSYQVYNLHRICGTVIAKNKDHSTVTILTTTGVVDIKFRKDYYSLFDKQITALGPDGKKKVMERSWFNRGTMIMVQGIRRGDSFTPKKYSSTPGHELYKITGIDANGEIGLTSERYQGNYEEDTECIKRRK